MRYIEVKENKIIGHYAGSSLPPKKDGIKYSILDDNAHPTIGDDVSFYEDLKAAKKKSLKQLIKEGLKRTPKGKKLNEAETDFVEMTEAEKWEAGLLHLQPTQWLDDDSENIREKTKKELLDAKLISVTEYNEYIQQQRKSAYAQESDPLGFQFMRGEIEKEVWLKKISEIKERYPKYIQWQLQLLNG